MMSCRLRRPSLRIDVTELDPGRLEEPAADALGDNGVEEPDA